MDPIEFKSFDEYKNTCYTMLYAACAIILVINLILIFANANKLPFIASFLIASTICGLIIYNKVTVCKNNYESAWNTLRSLGYKDAEPSTHEIAKNLYYLNKRLMNRNNNPAFQRF